MRNLLLRSIPVIAILGISPVYAAELNVNWVAPEDFTDVKPVNENLNRFRERTSTALEDFLTQLASELPPQQKLAVTVTDLDLAGEVWPASFVGFGNTGADVRLVKRVYIPRMTFSYSLIDETGALVKEAEVKLKDMSFMDGVSSIIKDKPLGYEKHMLKEWFNNEFKPELSASL
ncbi:DUF3016 domain-containing protein [Alteromonas sp. ASW11-130]|uniref:DUF3016 domain-containing protein n=1 Tax=Alteromonas sp. ASW11-130 TaxID=3015775 RepID=UPI0022422075|nr:DUF3016 domain-containing protein [Alteromonas sp. ASW11-130]MCW8090521.1 DUF3016 domain-containing protein [Alteromonas sp. ASW11-130]